MYFIGVDLGTNGIKVGITDKEGHVIESSYRETKLISPKPGFMEQEPQDFITGTLNAIRDILKKTKIDPGMIKSLSIDGQMGGVIGIDSEYESITDFNIGLDARSEKYDDYICSNFSKLIMSKTYGSPRNAPKIIWWKKEHPDVYKRIKKFVMLNSYVAGKLAGLKSKDAFIDYTLLSLFGIEDIKKQDWSEDICDALGIDIEKLPGVVRPWDIVGKLTGYAADNCGLKEGTLIAAGAADQVAGLLGAGLIKTGTLFEVAGSSTVQFLVVDKIVRHGEDDSIFYMPSIIPGLFYAFNYVNGGGICLRWFRDEFMGYYDREKGLAKANGFKAIERKIKDIPPGSEGLIFIPYFGGRQCPYDTTLRGAWIGLKWGHKIEHLYRAILEALAYNSRLAFDNLLSMFPDYKPDQVIITGGGSKSDIWNQIKADVTGFKYLRAKDFEINIRGSGIIAGFGAGEIEDMVATAANIDIADRSMEFLPDPKNKDVYDRYCDTFRNLFVNDLAKTFRALFKQTSGGFKL